MTGGWSDKLGRVGVWLGGLGNESAAIERETAAELEDAGWQTLWVGESPRQKDALVHAGLLLAATSKMKIATGIASIYARDALATRIGGDALAEAYDGRFVLGLGVSHRPLVEGRGSEYGKPIPAMTAYLDRYEAAEYGPPQPAAPVPVLLAALRPAMLRLARARADGAHPYLVPVEHTARAREILGSGRLLAPELGVLLETDRAAARERGRAVVSRYFEMPNYVNNLRWLGYGDSDFAAGGSDRLIEQTIAAGDVEAIVTRVRGHLQAGADHVCVQPLADDLRTQLEWLRSLRPGLMAL